MDILNISKAIYISMWALSFFAGFALIVTSLIGHGVAEDIQGQVEGMKNYTYGEYILALLLASLWLPFVIAALIILISSKLYKGELFKNTLNVICEVYKKSWLNKRPFDK